MRRILKRPSKDFHFLNNISKSLNDVECFLECSCKLNHTKKIYTLFKKWKS